MVDGCQHLGELVRFERAMILERVGEENRHNEEMIADVIKQFAPEYRKLYCTTICPGRYDCKAFEEDKKLYDKE